MEPKSVWIIIDKMEDEYHGGYIYGDIYGAFSTREKAIEVKQTLLEHSDNLTIRAFILDRTIEAD